MYQHAIGLDFGNAHATGAIYSGGNEHILSLPSASAPGSIHDHHSMQTGTGGETSLNPYTILKSGEHVFSYNGGSERFIGELALRQTRKSSTGRGDINRYWSPRALEFLLTLAGTLIPDDHFSLLVVTGLPIETYKSDEAKMKVKKMLNGEHHFTLDGRSRFAQVKVGKVLMEGAGASLRLKLSKDRLCGVIDIGEFTTDVYAARGLEAASYLCGGTEVGIANASASLSLTVSRDYNRSLTAKECMDILHAYVSSEKQYPIIDTSFGEVPSRQLDTWVYQALRAVGREVNEFVSSLWRSGSAGTVASEFNQEGIRVIGGGAYYLLNTVREIIPSAIISPEPEYANARGYGWLANTLLASTQRVSA